jgi:prepilin-type N-terminal cleavage/methylation domain-containing protein
MEINKKNNNNKGFTLVEIIIVVAIATIIAGLFVVNFVRYIERTNVSADVQLANGLRTALLAAIADPQVDGPQKAEFMNTFTASASVTQPVIIDDLTFDPVSSDNAFAMSVAETLILEPDQIATGLKHFLRSHRNAPEFAVIVSRDNVIVAITGTNRNAVVVTPAAGLTADCIVSGADSALGPFD